MTEREALFHREVRGGLSLEVMFEQRTWIEQEREPCKNPREGLTGRGHQAAKSPGWAHV